MLMGVNVTECDLFISRIRIRAHAKGAVLRKTTHIKVLLICVAELTLRDVASEEVVVGGATVSAELDPRAACLRVVVVAVHHEEVRVLGFPERGSVIFQQIFALRARFLPVSVLDM